MVGAGRGTNESPSSSAGPLYSGDLGEVFLPFFDRCAQTFFSQTRRQVHIDNMSILWSLSSNRDDDKLIGRHAPLNRDSHVATLDGDREGEKGGGSGGGNMLELEM